jgi:hypothetical protein
VRRLWPLLRAEFGRGFVSFCEKQMSLGVVTGKPVAIDGGTKVQQFERLCLEHQSQWKAPGDQRWLLHRIAQVQSGVGDHKGWLVYPDTLYPLDQVANTQGNGQIAAGVILVSQVQDWDAQTLGERLYDFLVWIRGAYRNTGLGRPAVAEVLQALGAELLRPFVLRVHLPLQGQRGPGGIIQLANWQRFFQHHDFVPVTLDHAAKPNESLHADNYLASAIILERKFGQAN